MPEAKPDKREAEDSAGGPDVKKLRTESGEPTAAMEAAATETPSPQGATQDAAAAENKAESKEASASAPADSSAREPSAGGSDAPPSEGSAAAAAEAGAKAGAKTDDANANTKPGADGASSDPKPSNQAGGKSEASTEGKRDGKSDSNGKADPKPKDAGQEKKDANPDLENYRKLRKTLKGLIGKKVALDRELEEIEERLYVEEGVYLQDASAGNVAKGFDQYTKGNQNRRKSMLGEGERVFSQSSTSFEAES